MSVMLATIPRASPSNIFLGTPKQNSDDMRRKGRARWAVPVLNEPTVAEMKRRFLLGESTRDVATELGLSYDTAYAVKTGETWKRVPPAGNPMDVARLKATRAPALSNAPRSKEDRHGRSACSAEGAKCVPAIHRPG